MKAKILLLLSLALATSQAKAYENQLDSAYCQNIISQYTDSLETLRNRISAIRSDSKSLSPQLYRLFMPFTFYHSTSATQLAVNAERAETYGQLSDGVEEALMNMYLKRPDLVTNNETNLQQSGTIRDDIDMPVQPKQTVLADKNKKEEVVEMLPEVQSSVVIQKPNFWKYSGDGNLQLLQNYVSGNWYKGGESNYSMVGTVILTANYDNKQKFKFDNKLEMKLGYQTSRGDSLHSLKTNNDLFRYTGKIGLQAHKNWYYSLQLLAYTQFTQGYKSNDPKVYSDFMSPFNLNVGLGLDYQVHWLNDKLKGTVNLSFLSFNFRYVDRKELAPANGIRGDHRTLEDFGSQMTADLTWQLRDNVKWRTRLYGYTSYSRALVEWENTFTFTVSKYISTNLFLYPRFDDSTNKKDDDLGYIQFKEYLSLGMSYSF